MMKPVEPIYLDNAATTPLAPEVLEAMMPYLQAQYGNPSSIHSFGRSARAAVERARKRVADHLNASSGEIFFTSCGTESNNTALKCAVRDLGVTRIISSPIEHHCVESTLNYLVDRGYITLDLVAIAADGSVDMEHLEGLLSAGNGAKTLVSLMHANNEIGNITDIEQVGRLCRAHHALFHSDTVQTVAHYPIDLQQLEVDFISGSAHKFHGPKGMGILYVNSAVTIAPHIHGGAQERNMRAGTENVAGIVGTAAALDQAYKNLEQESEHIRGIKRYMMERLSGDVPGICFNGDAENGLYTVVNVNFPQNGRNEMLLFNLDINGISASGGSACSSGSDIGSHVIAQLPAAPESTSIRFSFSRYTTIEQIDRTIDVVRETYLVPAVTGGH